MVSLVDAAAPALTDRHRRDCGAPPHAADSRGNSGGPGNPRTASLAKVQWHEQDSADQARPRRRHKTRTIPRPRTARIDRARCRTEAQAVAARIAAAWRAEQNLHKPDGPLHRHRRGALPRHCGIAAEICADLNDIDYGAWQFKTFEQASSDDAALFDAWFATPQFIRFPDGESLQDLVARAANARAAGAIAPSQRDDRHGRPRQREPRAAARTASINRCRPIGALRKRPAASMRSTLQRGTICVRRVNETRAPARFGRDELRRSLGSAARGFAARHRQRLLCRGHFVRRPIAHARGALLPCAWPYPRDRHRAPTGTRRCCGVDLYRSCRYSANRFSAYAHRRARPYRQPILATDRVRYVGEPVAVMFAADPYIAEDAADLVAVEIDPLAESLALTCNPPRSTMPRIRPKWPASAKAMATSTRHSPPLTRSSH